MSGSKESENSHRLPDYPPDLDEVDCFVYHFVIMLEAETVLFCS